MNLSFPSSALGERVLSFINGLKIESAYALENLPSPLFAKEKKFLS
jgi:hypothetical protein